MRARPKGDIQSVFSKAKVLRTRSADYIYRAAVTRAQAAKVLVALAMGMQYDNVKVALPRSTPRRSEVMSKVWAVGLAEQDRET